MYTRKPSGQRFDQLERIFGELPEAGRCFDIAHAGAVAGLDLGEGASRNRRVPASSVPRRNQASRNRRESSAIDGYRRDLRHSR